MKRPALDARTLQELLGADADAVPQRAPLHSLVALLREAAALTVALESRPDVHQEVAALAPGLQDLVARLRDLPRVASAARAELPVSMLPERSPVSGRANVLAAPVAYRFEADRTVAQARYDQQHEGPAGGAHGGVVAATFDELLGVAQMQAGAAGYTVELDIRYHRVTPLYRPVTYEAWIESTTPTRLTLSAHSHEGEQLLAEARGVFAVREELTRRHIGGQSQGHTGTHA